MTPAWQSNVPMQILHRHDRLCIATNPSAAGNRPPVRARALGPTRGPSQRPSSSILARGVAARPKRLAQGQLHQPCHMSSHARRQQRAAQGLSQIHPPGTFRLACWPVAPLLGATALYKQAAACPGPTPARRPLCHVSVASCRLVQIVSLNPPHAPVNKLTMQSAHINEQCFPRAKHDPSSAQYSPSQAVDLCCSVRACRRWVV
mgnify:CR=1 FL=1